MNKIIGVFLLVIVYFLARDVLKKVDLEGREDIKLAKIRTGGATVLLLMLAIFHFITDLTFCEFYPSFCDRFPGFCGNFPYLCR